MLTIENANDNAVAELEEALHPDDAAELAAAGLTVHQALAGARMQAARWCGRLVALFGCAPHPAGGGIPWMLCTTTVEEVPRRAMAARSARVVAGWMAEHAELSNLVHRSNARALRFVWWLGFSVIVEPAGPRGEFYQFHWSRNV